MFLKVYFFTSVYTVILIGLKDESGYKIRKFSGKEMIMELQDRNG